MANENYDIVRTFLEEQIGSWEMIERERKQQGDRLSDYGEGTLYAYRVVLNLMNDLQHEEGE